ncbi:MAG: epoxyqueuosine reductase, partial [Firmicutes bacterium]|nr:epoxyqueuosine reductase [Bacillota bacterium]
GLGTFGLNNMLITDKGCSGRYNCLVTNLEVEADSPKKEEACLYIKDGTCGACMVKCPAGAISPDGFDRHKCYEQCLKNAAVYTGFGSSYAETTENDAAPTYGSEVCGKCIAGMPCAYREVK